MSMICHVHDNKSDGHDCDYVMIVTGGYVPTVKGDANADANRDNKDPAVSVEL